jgi:PadR family transcriptional regulator PadR
VFGLWFIEELASHGYKLSPGTLYPILHSLEENGYLRSSVKRTGRQSRRVYRATSKGKKALAAAKEKVSELFGELFDERRELCDARSKAVEPDEGSLGEPVRTR